MVFCFSDRERVSMVKPERLHQKALHAAEHELASTLHEQLDRMQDCLIAEQRKAVQVRLHVGADRCKPAEAVRSKSS